MKKEQREEEERRGGGKQLRGVKILRGTDRKEQLASYQTWGGELIELKINTAPVHLRGFTRLMQGYQRPRVQIWSYRISVSFQEILVNPSNEPGKSK